MTKSFKKEKEEIKDRRISTKSFKKELFYDRIIF